MPSRGGLGRMAAAGWSLRTVRLPWKAPGTAQPALIARPVNPRDSHDPHHDQELPLVNLARHVAQGLDVHLPHVENLLNAIPSQQRRHSLTPEP